MVNINTIVIEWTDSLTNLANITNLTDLTDKEYDDYVRSMNTKTWGYNLKTMVPSVRNTFYLTS